MMKGMGKGLDNSYVLYMIHDMCTIKPGFYSRSRRDLGVNERGDTGAAAAVRQIPESGLRNAKYI